LPLALV